MQMTARRDMTPRTSEQGSILIMTALVMTVLLGVAALSIDASFAFDLRNRLAAAADAAAKSAALEVKRDNSANITAFAQAEVDKRAATGLIPPGVSVDAHLCTAVGATCAAPYTTPKYVEVFLESTQSTFFGRIFGAMSLTPRVRAVAGSAEAVDCWVIFEDLTAKNNNDFTLTGCGVSVGDEIDLGNNSSITADSVGAGDCCGSGTVTPSWVQIAVPPDPLAHLLAPTDPGPACSSPVTLGTMTLNPGHYCGWEFDGPGNTLTLNPGTYYITDGITAKNGGTDVNIVGSGVMIYLAPGGYIDLGASNHVSMDLSAQTSGTYSGILFYQDRANTHAVEFGKNNGDMKFSGASYFPSADVSVKNNLDWSANCTLFVAKSLEMKNNANINNNCSAFGGTPWKSIALAE
jgi:hypothetical protein